MSEKNRNEDKMWPSIGETDMRKNQLILLDSIDAIARTRERHRSLHHDLILYQAREETHFLAGVYSVVDSIGILDIFAEPSFSAAAYQKSKEKIRTVLVCNALLYALLSLSFLSAKKEKISTLYEPDPEKISARKCYAEMIGAAFEKSEETYFKACLSDMISSTDGQYFYPAFLEPIIKVIVDRLIEQDENNRKDERNDEEDTKSFQKLLNLLMKRVAMLMGKGNLATNRARESRARKTYADLATRIEFMLTSIPPDEDLINNALLEVMKEKIFHPRFLSGVSGEYLYSYSVLLEKEIPIVFGRSTIKENSALPEERFCSFKSLIELVTLLAIDFWPNNIEMACTSIKACLLEPCFTHFLKEKNSRPLVTPVSGKKATSEAAVLNRTRAFLAAKLFDSWNSEDYGDLLRCVPAKRPVSTDNQVHVGEDGRICLKKPVPFDAAYSVSPNSLIFKNQRSAELIINDSCLLSEAICQVLLRHYSKEGKLDTPLLFTIKIESSCSDADTDSKDT